MFTVYNVFLACALPVIRLASLFNPKLRRGLEGRRDLFLQTEEHYRNFNIVGPRILVHVASFGELEQAKPVIQALKEQYHAAHIHLTFFSPSGYENTVGKYSDADYISYAPFDRKADVKKFLDITKPDVVLFARYDVWPNMALELNGRKIPSILFAATASENSGRMLPIIRSFSNNVFRNLSKILSISEEDRSRFIQLGIDVSKISVGGDTRFDQVAMRKDRIEESTGHQLPAKIEKNIEEKGTLVFVVGSSWESDVAIYLETIQQSVQRNDNILTIIAPHETTEDHVRKLLSQFPSKSIRYSRIDDWDGESVVVVDSIGKLFGIYRYADVAMIGGGFGDGLHNILEAAVWGVPAIVGPNHKRSQEVSMLIDRLAAFEVANKKEFEFVFWRLAKSDDLRRTAGTQAVEFIKQNEGATRKIMAEVVQCIDTKDQDRS